jgi:hypothetical protein
MTKNFHIVFFPLPVLACGLQVNQYLAEFESPFAKRSDNPERTRLKEGPPRFEFVFSAFWRFRKAADDLVLAHLPMLSDFIISTTRRDFNNAAVLGFDHHIGSRFL